MHESPWGHACQDAPCHAPLSMHPPKGLLHAANATQSYPCNQHICSARPAALAGQNTLLRALGASRRSPELAPSPHTAATAAGAAMSRCTLVRQPQGKALALCNYMSSSRSPQRTPYLAAR